MDELQATLKTQQRFSLNWTYLDAITRGVSVIDMGALALRNLGDARQFAREYGYDIDQPGVLDYLRGIQREAIAFVRAQFLGPDQQGLLPAELEDDADPLRLLVLASQRAHRFEPTRLWACALLKVMHGLFYIDNNLKLRHFNAIRQQVFAGLDAVLQVEGEQQYLTDGLICLPLLHVDRKRNKGRHSILVKLLQKPEYVAADIHDHLGVRLTLGTRIECLLALDLLRRAHLVTLTNLEISRVRNTLVDLCAAKEVFNCHRAEIDRCQGYPQQVLQQMDRELARISQRQTQRDNPHSAADFQSIQLTVRKMIHLPAAALGLPPESSSAAEEGAEGPIANGGGTSFFFAYEIQLLDGASFEKSQQGAASHEAYKRRQVESARRRVLGAELLDWLLAH